MPQSTLDTEPYLMLLSQSISELQWWRFDFAPSSCPKHLWISLPHEVQIVSGKSSPLPPDSKVLGRLNIFTWGEDCSINGIRITPSQQDQMVCIETRGSENQSQIIWIDVNRPALVTTVAGNQEVVDVRKLTQPPPGSQVCGWLSGLEIPHSVPQIIRRECFLVPVDFENREDVVVLLSQHSTLRDGDSILQAQSSTEKFIIVNSQTEDPCSHPYELMNASQTFSSLENNESLRETEHLLEIGEDLDFPASMMDEETSKGDTNLSETLVELEDLFNRVVWIIQHPSEETLIRDENVEAQRRRIAMQLDEMRNFEEECQNKESNRSLSLLDKLLAILTYLLEIGEMVSKHRRVDSRLLLRLVEKKLPELTSWLNQSKTDDVPLPLASQTFTKITYIQSALTCLSWPDQSDIDLNSTLSKVKLFLDDAIEKEINEKIENQLSEDRLHFNINNVLCDFMETLHDCLSKMSFMKVPHKLQSSDPLRFLQQINANLTGDANFLKANCAWIYFILDEEILERLEISQQNYAHLKLLYNDALKTYKLLIIRSRLVCECSVLQALATRLNRVFEQCSRSTLSRWEICQLEKEVDSCEAECALETLCAADAYAEFVQEIVNHLRETISSLRRVLNEVEIKKETSTEEFMERLNPLVSRPHLSSPLTTPFEALLVGWYLQNISAATNQLNEWISQQEKKTADDLQNVSTVEYYVSLLEDFIQQIPSTLPSNVEALSLRETLLILSDIIHRGNVAIQLLERFAFLTSSRTTQPLHDLCLAYSRAIESLSLCFRALEGVLREFLEWRNCLVLKADPDYVVTPTQNLIESINFATDVLSQEIKNIEAIRIANTPDFLSKIMAWLSNLRTKLFGFPTAVSEARVDNSTIFNHTDAFLQQLLDFEWRLSDSSFLIRRDLIKENGKSFAERHQFNWLSNFGDLNESIDIAKRRTFLSVEESLERSVKTRSSSIFILLSGSREADKMTHGFSITGFIVSLAEKFQDVNLWNFIDEYNEDDPVKGFDDNFSKSNQISFFHLLKSNYEEYKRILGNKSSIETNLQLSQCLKRSEILSEIGSKWVAALKQPPYVINRILCCHWPKVLRWLIHFDQSHMEPVLCPDWCNCALDLRNVVAKSLVPDNLNPNGFLKIRMSMDDALKNLHTCIQNTESILNEIPVNFKLQYDDVWQTCSRLCEISKSYSTQLHDKIKDLTLYSLPKVKKDIHYLENRLIELARTTGSGNHIEDCSSRIVQLERSLQSMRRMSRILFTCLAARPKASPITRPSKHLDVSELYNRAVKLVRDYESSEIGCQILRAWRKLLSFADRLGRFQAGLPISDPCVQIEAGITKPPTNKPDCEEYSSASMARKRSWTLLEVLGSHECLYPGCRGRKGDNHANDDENGTLVHELHAFYSVLCSDFHNCANRLPLDFLSLESNAVATTGIVLMKLREEWHHDIELVNQFTSLQRRVKLDTTGRSEIKSIFTLIEHFWGSIDTPRFVTEATRKLATVSSWLCEVEQQMDIVILPRLQTAWKTLSKKDPIWDVEECVYKMNEIAEDLKRLQRGGMIAERSLQSIRYSLRAGWFSVREFLLYRCNKITLDSARYFPLVDNFMHHSESLGFKDCLLMSIQNRLCNYFLLKGPSRERPGHDYPAGKRFCSTRRSLRSLFLPSWFTGRCLLVNDRPPIALTIHSLPDISSEAYPSSEPTFHSPRCTSLKFQRWMSLPEIRSNKTVSRKRIGSSFLLIEKDAESTDSPFIASQKAIISPSECLFSTSYSKEGNIGDLNKSDASIDREYRTSMSESTRRKSRSVGTTNSLKRSPSGLERPKASAAYESIPSKKLREKSPITWCTVYLPNDEEVEPLAHQEIVPEKSVVQIAGDPMFPQREVYAPMVFSAPFDTMEEVTVDEEFAGVEDSEKYGPLIIDDSGVCDWLRAQQAENIQRLIQEYGYSSDDMLPAESDDVSKVSLPYLRNKNSASASFEESGLGEEEWSRKSLELSAIEQDCRLLNENPEGRIDWGPLIERAESPHLSVIFETPTDESVSEQQRSVIGISQQSSEEVSDDEGVRNYDEWVSTQPNMAPYLQPTEEPLDGVQKLELYTSTNSTGGTESSIPIAISFEDKDVAISTSLNHSPESDSEVDETISAVSHPESEPNKFEMSVTVNTIEVDVEDSGDELMFTSEESPVSVLQESNLGAVRKNQLHEKADENFEPAGNKSLIDDDKSEIFLLDFEKSTEVNKRKGIENHENKAQEIEEAEDGEVSEGIVYAKSDETSKGNEESENPEEFGASSPFRKSLEYAEIEFHREDDLESSELSVSAASSSQSEKNAVLESQVQWQDVDVDDEAYRGVDDNPTEKHTLGRDESGHEESTVPPTETDQDELLQNMNETTTSGTKVKEQQLLQGFEKRLGEVMLTSAGALTDAKSNNQSVAYQDQMKFNANDSPEPRKDAAFKSLAPSSDVSSIESEISRGSECKVTSAHQIMITEPDASIQRTEANDNKPGVRTGESTLFPLLEEIDSTLLEHPGHTHETKNLEYSTKSNISCQSNDKRPQNWEISSAKEVQTEEIADNREVQPATFSKEGARLRSNTNVECSRVDPNTAAVKQHEDSSDPGDDATFTSLLLKGECLPSESKTSSQSDKTEVVEFEATDDLTAQRTEKRKNILLDVKTEESELFSSSIEHEGALFECSGTSAGDGPIRHRVLESVNSSYLKDEKSEDSKMLSAESGAGDELIRIDNMGLLKPAISGVSASEIKIKAVGRQMEPVGDFVAGVSSNMISMPNGDWIESLYKVTRDRRDFKSKITEKTLYLRKDDERLLGYLGRLDQEQKVGKDQSSLPEPGMEDVQDSELDLDVRLILLDGAEIEKSKGHDEESMLEIGEKCKAIQLTLADNVRSEDSSDPTSSNFHVLTEVRRGEPKSQVFRKPHAGVNAFASDQSRKTANIMEVSSSSREVGTISDKLEEIASGKGDRFATNLDRMNFDVRGVDSFLSGNDTPNEFEASAHEITLDMMPEDVPPQSKQIKIVESKIRDDDALTPVAEEEDEKQLSFKSDGSEMHSSSKDNDNDLSERFCADEPFGQSAGDTDQPEIDQSKDSEISPTIGKIDKKFTKTNGIEVSKLAVKDKMKGGQLLPVDDFDTTSPSELFPMPTCDQIESQYKKAQGRKIDRSKGRKADLDQDIGPAENALIFPSNDCDRSRYISGDGKKHETIHFTTKSDNAGEMMVNDEIFCGDSAEKAHETLVEVRIFSEESDIGNKLARIDRSKVQVEEETIPQVIQTAEDRQLKSEYTVKTNYLPGSAFMDSTQSKKTRGRRQKKRKNRENNFKKNEMTKVLGSLTSNDSDGSLFVQQDKEYVKSTMLKHQLDFGKSVTDEKLVLEDHDTGSTNLCQLLGNAFQEIKSNTRDEEGGDVEKLLTSRNNVKVDEIESPENADESSDDKEEKTNANARTLLAAYENMISETGDDEELVTLLKQLVKSLRHTPNITMEALSESTLAVCTDWMDPHRKENKRRKQDKLKNRGNNREKNEAEEELGAKIAGSALISEICDEHLFDQREDEGEKSAKSPLRTDKLEETRLSKGGYFEVSTKSTSGEGNDTGSINLHPEVEYISKENMEPLSTKGTIHKGDNLEVETTTKAEEDLTSIFEKQDVEEHGDFLFNRQNNMSQSIDNKEEKLTANDEKLFEASGEIDLELGNDENLADLTHPCDVNIQLFSEYKSETPLHSISMDTMEWREVRPKKNQGRKKKKSTDKANEYQIKGTEKVEDLFKLMQSSTESDGTSASVLEKNSFEEKAVSPTLQDQSITDMNKDLRSSNCILYGVPKEVDSAQPDNDIFRKSLVSLSAHEDAEELKGKAVIHKTKQKEEIQQVSMRDIQYHNGSSRYTEDLVDELSDQLLRSISQGNIETVLGQVHELGDYAGPDEKFVQDAGAFSGKFKSSKLVRVREPVIDQKDTMSEIMEKEAEIRLTPADSVRVDTLSYTFSMSSPTWIESQPKKDRGRRKKKSKDVKRDLIRKDIKKAKDISNVAFSLSIKEEDSVSGSKYDDRSKTVNEGVMMLNAGMPIEESSERFSGADGEGDEEEEAEKDHLTSLNSLKSCSPTGAGFLDSKPQKTQRQNYEKSIESIIGINANNAGEAVGFDKSEIILPSEKQGESVEIAPESVVDQPKTDNDCVGEKIEKPIEGIKGDNEFLLEATTHFIVNKLMDSEDTAIDIRAKSGGVSPSNSLKSMVQIKPKVFSDSVLNPDKWMNSKFKASGTRGRRKSKGIKDEVTRSSEERLFMDEIEKVELPLDVERKLSYKEGLQCPLGQNLSLTEIVVISEAPEKSSQFETSSWVAEIEADLDADSSVNPEYRPSAEDLKYFKDIGDDKEMKERKELTIDSFEEGVEPLVRPSVLEEVLLSFDKDKNEASISNKGPSKRKNKSKKQNKPKKPDLEAVNGVFGSSAGNNSKPSTQDQTLTRDFTGQNGIPLQTNEEEIENLKNIQSELSISEEDQTDNIENITRESSHGNGTEDRSLADSHGTTIYQFEVSDSCHVYPPNDEEKLTPLGGETAKQVQEMREELSVPCVSMEESEENLQTSLDPNSSGQRNQRIEETAEISASEESIWKKRKRNSRTVESNATEAAEPMQNLPSEPAHLTSALAKKAEEQLGRDNILGGEAESNPTMEKEKFPFLGSLKSSDLSLPFLGNECESEKCIGDDKDEIEMQDGADGVIRIAESLNVSSEPNNGRKIEFKTMSPCIAAEPEKAESRESGGRFRQQGNLEEVSKMNVKAPILQGFFVESQSSEEELVKVTETTSSSENADKVDKTFNYEYFLEKSEKLNKESPFSEVGKKTSCYLECVQQMDSLTMKGQSNNENPEDALISRKPLVDKDDIPELPAVEQSDSTIGQISLDGDDAVYFHENSYYLENPLAANADSIIDVKNIKSEHHQGDSHEFQELESWVAGPENSKTPNFIALGVNLLEREPERLEHTNIFGEGYMTTETSPAFRQDPTDSPGNTSEEVNNRKVAPPEAATSNVNIQSDELNKKSDVKMKKASPNEPLLFNQDTPASRPTNVSQISMDNEESEAGKSIKQIDLSDVPDETQIYDPETAIELQSNQTKQSFRSKFENSHDLEATVTSCPKPLKTESDVEVEEILSGGSDSVTCLGTIPAEQSHKMITLPECEKRRGEETSDDVDKIIVDLRLESTSRPKEEEESPSPHSSIELISPADLESSEQIQAASSAPPLEDIECRLLYGINDEVLEQDEAAGSVDLSFTLAGRSPDSEKTKDVNIELGSVKSDTKVKTVEPVEVLLTRCNRLRPILLPLLLLPLFLVLLIILLCVAAPDFCILPGPCPGLDLRRRINSYLQEILGRHLSPNPI